MLLSQDDWHRDWSEAVTVSRLNVIWLAMAGLLGSVALVVARSACDTSAPPSTPTDSSALRAPPSRRAASREASIPSTLLGVRTIAQDGFCSASSLPTLSALLDAPSARMPELVDIVVDESETAATRETALRLLVCSRRLDHALVERVSTVLSSPDWRVGELVAELLPGLEPFPLDAVSLSLDGTEPHRAHIAAAQCLAIRGRLAESAIPALVRALDRDAALPPGDRSEDLDLGGRIDRPDESHVVAYKSAERCQLAIIHALSTIGSDAPVAIDALLRRRSAPHPVREAAFQALAGTLAGRQALTDLASSDAEPAIRLAALECIATADLSSGVSESQLVMCAERDEPTGDVSARQAALRALGRLPSPGLDTVGTLRRALQSPLPQIRTSAAHAIGSSGGLEAALSREVGDALTDPDPRVVTAALEAIRTSDRHLLARTGMLLDSPSADIQSAAAACYARVADRGDLLDELTRPRASHFAALYVKALTRFPDRTADSWERVAYLRGSTDQRVIEALVQLAQGAGPTGTQAVASMGRRLSSARARVAVVEFVAGSGTEQCSLALAPYLQDESEAVRAAAMGALLRLTQGTMDLEAGVRQEMRRAGIAARHAVAIAVVCTRPDLAVAMMQSGDVRPESLVCSPIRLSDDEAIAVARLVESHARHFVQVRGLARFAWRSERRLPPVEAAREEALQSLTKVGSE